MSARRALTVDVDVATLSPLAANSAARRSLDARLTFDTVPVAVPAGPARRAADNANASVPTQTARRAQLFDAGAEPSARRALPDAGLPAAVAVAIATSPARALQLPARALPAELTDAELADGAVRVNCAPRRALDLDELTTTLPLIIDPAAFVEKPRRIKKFAIGLAAFVLLGSLGSQLAVQSSVSALFGGQFAAPAVAANVDAAARQDEQTSRDGVRPDIGGTDTDEELAAMDAAVAQEQREHRAQLAAEQAEAARVKAEAEAKAARQAAVTGQIAPGQKAPLSVDEAMANAQRLSGSPNYQNLCLALVSNFYGYTSSGAIGAQQAANEIIAAGQMHYDMTDIPVGALIWYDGTGVGNPYGHVAMYAGDGMVYSNGHQNGVGLMSIYKPSDEWRQPLIGWSNVWLPAATK